MPLDSTSTSEEFTTFYEEGYSSAGADAQRAGAWRALSAQIKADHLEALLAGQPLPPAARCLDVGCGDGAVLDVLHRAHPGWELAGVEIAERPLELARERVAGADLRRFDGIQLPWEDGHFELAFASHVIEHVPHPEPVLREMGRVARFVMMEVPLEDNVSAKRASRRGISADLGHVQRFSAASARAAVESAGLTVLGELADPLPFSVHAFFADDAKARAKAAIKWASRAGLSRLHAPTAQRLFTVHYACLASAGG